MKEKEEFINKGVFSGSSSYQRGGGGVIFNCVKDDVIGGKEDKKSIGLHGFDYKLFEEDEGVGGFRGHRWVSIFESSN